jgi:hypothetical protein
MNAPHRPRRRATPATPRPDWRRWLPAVAAVAVLVIVVIAGVGGSSGSGSNASSSDLGAVDDSSVTAPSSIVDPVVVESDPALPKTNLAKTIGYGSAGPDVKMVQQRLTDLKFAPGPIDGQFGKNTQQAVWAFEKLVMKTPREQATGRVTDAMWQVMQENVVLAPRRKTGPGSTHMEVYLPEQVAAVFTDDAAVLITHISSGVENPDRSPKEWCETVRYDTDENGNPLDTPVEKPVCALAKTPGGVFRFTRRYVGKREGPLGGMMNPVYFNYGIAIHGADNVPLEPASHGCVRINQNIASFFQSLVKKGDLVYVWGEDGKQPEQYTKQESYPSFNYADPNATTTTSTTTTVAPTSTTAPSTTVPRTTVPATTVPATTTTAGSATTTTTG